MLDNQTFKRELHPLFSFLNRKPNRNAILRRLRKANNSTIDTLRVDGASHIVHPDVNDPLDVLLYDSIYSNDPKVRLASMLKIYLVYLVNVENSMVLSVHPDCRRITEPTSRLLLLTLIGKYNKEYITLITSNKGSQHSDNYESFYRAENCLFDIVALHHELGADKECVTELLITLIGNVEKGILLEYNHFNKLFNLYDKQDWIEYDRTLMIEYKTKSDNLPYQDAVMVLELYQHYRELIKHNRTHEGYGEIMEIIDGVKDKILVLNLVGMLLASEL